MFDKPLLLSSLIEHAGSYHGESAISFCIRGDEVHTLTWGELSNCAKTIAAQLETRLPSTPQTVAITGENSAYRLASMFAIAGMGHSYVNIAKSAQTTHDHEAYQFVLHIPSPLQQSEIDIELYESRYQLKTDPPVTTSTSSKISIQLDGCHQDFEWPIFDETATAAVIVTHDENDEITTYEASHRELILNAFAISLPDSLGLSSYERIFSCFQLDEFNAWSIPFAAALVGCQLALSSDFADNIPQAVNAFYPTMCIASGKTWSDVIARSEIENLKFESLSRAVLIGEDDPLVLMRILRNNFDCDLIRAWGLPETGMLNTFNIPLPKHETMTISEYENLRRLEGRPPFGVRFRIIDDEGTVLPWDGRTAGRLEYQSLWADSQKQALSNPDPWRKTDLVARIGKDGFIHIQKH